MSVPGDVRASVKAVIFDIGGILEPPFDDLLWPEMASTLGIPTARLRQRQAADGVALTEGRMTLRDFYARVAAEVGRPVDPDAAVERHLALYGAGTAQLDVRILGLIERLRGHHLVACLSNTEVEVGHFNRRRGLFAPFDRVFLSTELGLRKPAPAIFERVLTELGCAPSEAVFTDDKLENVLGAQAVNMRAIHYRDFEGFSRDLARLLEPGA